MSRGLQSVSYEGSIVHSGQTKSVSVPDQGSKRVRRTNGGQK